MYPMMMMTNCIMPCSASPLLQFISGFAAGYAGFSLPSYYYPPVFSCNPFAYAVPMPTMPVMPYFQPVRPRIYHSAPIFPSFGSITISHAATRQGSYNQEIDNYQRANTVQNTNTTVQNQSCNYDNNSLPQIRNSSLMRNVPNERKNQILSAVDEACKQYGIDPKLVISMMFCESSFNPNATSPCGAAGLMQLMPATAKQYGASNPYDIRQNIFAAVKFLKYLKDRYNGNTDLMIAAYNAGPGKVKNTIPNIRETQRYVAKVKQVYASGRSFVA